MTATDTQKTSSNPRKRTTATTPLPPLAVAIARMVEPLGHNSVRADFVRAWAAMPAIVAAYARGEADSNAYVNAHSLIEEFVAKEIAASRKATEPFDGGLARAVDVLEADDLWTSVYCSVAKHAFTVGVALGAYVALNGGSAK